MFVIATRQLDIALNHAQSITLTKHFFNKNVFFVKTFLVKEELI